VFNNVYTRIENKGVKTILHDDMELQKKQRVIDSGGTPYAIGSVVGVYAVQDMLFEIVNKVFPRDGVKDAKIYLFDERMTTPPYEQFFAFYDPMLSEIESKERMTQNAHLSKAQVLADNPRAVEGMQSINGTTFQFSVLLAPNDDYLSEQTSFYPYCILCISVLLVFVGQCERWLGHPTILSESQLVQAKVEAKMRKDVEEKVASVMASSTLPDTLGWQ